MCQAHVLRFCCGHGILMGLDTCNLGPCPMIKTTGVKLPQQPYRCYNCQHKQSSLSRSSTSTSLDSSSGKSSVGSLDSVSSTSSYGGRPTSPTQSNKVNSRPMAPLPNVARQPDGCVKYYTGPRTMSTSTCMSTSSSSRRKAFTFSCSSPDHYFTPHYSSLPTFLPHQSHPCPPCQLSGMRSQSDAEVAAQAAAQFPHLKSEMLVRNGRVREDWQSNLTLDKYVAERRQEEREMWLHVCRKWSQDLKKARVLVAEEDGLGLFS